MIPGRTTAVFFDAGGTLIAPYPSAVDVYLRSLAPLGIDVEPESLRQAYLETWTEFGRLTERGRNRYAAFPGGEREFWRRYVGRVLERIGRSGRAGEAADLLHRAFSRPEAWCVFEDALPTVRALRARGLRVGVISNWDSRLPALLRGLGLAGEFETIVVSSEVDAEKPSAAIFEAALARLGVPPEAALHVGDDLEADYEGPRRLGMGAALLVRKGEPPPGIPVIRTLEALLGNPGGAPA
jgi:putative hydrolase of the HAD superfamily